MKFWNHATGDPWAITESALNNILKIASRENESVEAVSARIGRELDNSYVTEVRDGVAIIPVIGPLFRYANLFTAISGASSYEILAKDFMTALEDPEVEGIVLNIDSPGGEVNGCAEFASMIFEGRGSKPIIAYISGDAASGAYWIASACDEIITSETSSLGSIGVVAVYCGAKGGNTVEIVSSQSPYKRLDPDTDEGKARLQSRTDDLAAVFIESVALHRGVDPPTVIKEFGGGDVFIGKHAVAQGLADKIGSLEKTISSIHLVQNPAHERGSSFLAFEDSNMTDKTRKAEAPNLQTLSLESLKAEHPQLVESIKAEGRNESMKEGMRQGQQQERERIGAIVAAEAAKGREQLAQHLAFATDMSAEIALSTLEAAPMKVELKPQASVTGFEQAMASVDNPDIDPDGDEQEEDDADAVAKRIARFSQGDAA
jgi:signal peptide peptidase SppA